MDELYPHHYVFHGRLANQPTAKHLRRIVQALVVATGLRAISPVAVSVRGRHWSAFVMIAESHIAVHGIGVLGAADVVSCRAVDEEAAKRALREYLGGEWQAWDLERWRAYVKQPP